MTVDTSVPLVILGLGPAGLERLSGEALEILRDEHRKVIARTLEHPASRELARFRTVMGCDDLYRSRADFDAVYDAIADRVVAAAQVGRVAYVVPGSAVVGERAVPRIRRRAAALGVAVDVFPGESFLDLVYARAGVDPIATGLQVVDGRDLPDPFPLHVPTVITQVDRPYVLGDVAAVLGRVLPDNTPVTILDSLGSPDESVETIPLSDVTAREPGPRTTLFLSPPAVGWHGLVVINRRLRAECPWDREQTHHSLVSHLVEEAYETVDALSRLGPEAPRGEPDFGAYAKVEEELGDLLLQVVFHATLAAETGAFGVEEVAEGIRRKLVRRHPHVFGDVDATTPDQVIANWESLKTEEKARESLMDDVPGALPAIGRADKMQRRAASVGFDWDSVEPVIAKVREELDELDEVLADPVRAAEELGDMLFATVNLARHLGLDAELALRHAADTFSERFRSVELMASEAAKRLASMSLGEMDELWNRVKAAEASRNDDQIS